MPTLWAMRTGDLNLLISDQIASDSQILYRRDLGTRLNGLWRSTDFGSTWRQVASFPVSGGTSGAEAGTLTFYLMGPGSTSSTPLGSAVFGYQSSSE